MNFKSQNQRSPKRNQADMIFGTRAIIEAIKSGKTIDKLLTQKGLKNSLMTELFQIINEVGIPNTPVPVEKLNRVTKKNHQGAIAYISPIDYANVDNIIMQCYEDGKDPLILILDRITDVRNFGAIARTAESAGVNAIVVPSKGAAQIGSDAMKTSAGALNHIPVCKEHNLKETIVRLKDSGIKVLACSEKAEKFYHQEELSGPLALIMGSEEDGVSEAYWKLTDGSVKIPMLGQIDSLNVSVATAVILYESVRQRLN